MLIHKAVVSLSEAGLYTVTVTNSMGCTGTGTVRISRTAAEISSEFIVSSQVFTGEEVSMINISKPKPERMEWIVPQGAGVSVLSKDDNTLVLKFASAGEYEVGLKGYSGQCDRLFTRNVVVLEGQPFADVGSTRDPFIKEFVVYPNPSNGQFNAKVALLEQADIRLRMMEVISGKIVSDQKYSGNSSYLLPYTLNLPAGVYVMVLETPKGTRIFRTVIN